MSGPTPEFSRPVPLNRLGSEILRQGITATEGERQALARRFELLSLDRLIASVELQRQRNRTILLRAAFEAEFSQECVVTLEPVAGSVAETFALRYGPPEAEPSEEEQADDAAFEPLTSDVIDIGEAVAQELALALPPFPRGPDASVEAEVEDRRDTGPLAGLSRLFEQGSRR